jgi:hypothetical protein
MGNTIPIYVKNEMTEILNTIFSENYPILDIGHRKGATGYIDFIHPSELGDQYIMKGVDCFGRLFIVFKCEIIDFYNEDKYQTGEIFSEEKEEAKKRSFFTTFFQRYTGDETLYHTAGHYGNYLFDTQGGASVEQMRMLLELLKNGSLELNYEEIKKLRVTYREFYSISKEKTEIMENVIDVVKIGWTK